MKYCRECGKRIDGIKHRYISEVGERLEREQLCFDCDFWLEKVRWEKEGNEHGGVPVRVDGHHYLAYPGTNHTGVGLGFGGAQMRIRLFTGEVLESNNVWSQGEIPECFRKRLPDNAEFVRA